MPSQAKTTHAPSQQLEIDVSERPDLVTPIALHYARIARQDKDDLIQVGRLGLIKAAGLYQNSLRFPSVLLPGPTSLGRSFTIYATVLV